MAGFGPPGLGGAGASGGYPADSTVCPLCLAHHDRIVTLECGHDFCKRCLSQRTDGNMIRCPSCHRLMDLNEQGLEGLQSNYLINNILNIVSLSDQLNADLPTKGLASTKALWSEKSLHTSTCQMCRGTDVVASSVSISTLLFIAFCKFSKKQRFGGSRIGGLLNSFVTMGRICFA